MEERRLGGPEKNYITFYKSKATLKWTVQLHKPQETPGLESTSNGIFSNRTAFYLCFYTAQDMMDDFQINALSENH